MRYPPQILEEIRARLPASAVVGKRVRLKKAGREWRGLSPFNAEKTPSFYVNDQKQFYHCFSSGKHGDIFSFLMETEGLSFPEAVERLAAEAGVTLPKMTREDQEQEVRRNSLYDVMDLATEFFEASLKGRFGVKARDYLASRGLSPDTQAHFRIGYAPADRYSLRDYLAAKGVPPEMMEEAGLLVTAEDLKVPYDRFRDRIMFPISDVRGRIVAFGGRAMSADAPAKYLNSPDTPLFNKGRLLYNYHLARKPAHDRGTVIAVEGYVDVISLSVAGFHNAVAPLGTALTEDQLALLWRLSDEPILCFDGDKAGRRAAFRAVDTALPNLSAGKSLRFALLPEGQDPDDLAREGGPAAVERVLASARPLVDILWAREIEVGPLDTPERRAGLERRLRESLALIRDETLKRYYREDIESRISALNPDSRQNRYQRQAGGARWDRRGPLPTTPNARLSVSPLLAQSTLFMGGTLESPREAVILCVFLAHPELLQNHAEVLAEIELEGKAAQAFRRFLLDGAASGEPVDASVMQTRLERAGLTQAAEKLTGQVRPGDRWMLDIHADSLRLEDALRQAITLHRRARTLHSELRAAERALAEEDNEANLAWLREVQNQLSSVEGAEADSDNGVVHRDH
ncbi:DNA primase [Microvirga brassicacearum]|uniref:DNA primase n=1 Tax=Microvirga brassicacearum TaxID=2580413 RepID=A0A5N3PBL7_9HYPH|nr:DNA primase [Microvirga brassicacearum]KAB0267093.1 DNA primase [Microvirga brassicacearum]